MHHAYLPKTYYLSMQLNHRTVNVTANSKQHYKSNCQRWCATRW